MKWIALILGCMAAMVGIAAEESWTIEPVKPSFHWEKDAENIPKERDPLTPVDFVWPRPVKGNTNVEPVKATKNKAQLSLTVEFISYTPSERFAKVSGFTEFMEEGREYSFSAQGYKVTFKVHKIEPTKIIVDYEGDLLEFQPKTISGETGGKSF